MDKDWLQQLKPGDRVVIDHNYNKISIYPVERITATQIVVHGMRFRRATGFQLGGDYDRAMLHPVTPHYEDMALRQLVRRRMHRVLNSHATIEQMEIEKVRAIAQLLEEP